jgi:hypothetical protein
MVWPDTVGSDVYISSRASGPKLLEATLNETGIAQLSTFASDVLDVNTLVVVVRPVGFQPDGNETDLRE